MTFTKLPRELTSKELLERDWERLLRCRRCGFLISLDLSRSTDPTSQAHTCKETYPRRS
jgi:uncharacterized C2H2 Zn-finger protein